MLYGLVSAIALFRAAQLSRELYILWYSGSPTKVQPIQLAAWIAVLLALSMYCFYRIV